MNRSLLMVIALIILASCRNAPVIDQAGFCTDGGDGSYLVSEMIFTTTSKKSQGGSTMRSGYTTQYLYSVNIANGETLKRIKIGDFKARVDYLGMAGGKAWFFSYDPALSIHSRDPKSLAIINNSRNIMERNPSLSTGIAEMAYEHGIDSSGRFIVITSKDGYQYLLDPVSLRTTKAGANEHRRFYAIKRKSYAGNFPLNDSLEISFDGSGSPRRTLRVMKKRFDQSSYQFYNRPNARREPNRNLYYKNTGSTEYPDISFIDPEFMADNNSSCGENNRNPLLHGEHTIYLLSKSILGQDYNWIISAIDISYAGAPVVRWRYEIDRQKDTRAHDRELVDASITGKYMVFAFKNTLLALDLATGKLQWQKEN